MAASKKGSPTGGSRAPAARAPLKPKPSPAQTNPRNPAASKHPHAPLRGKTPPSQTPHPRPTVSKNPPKPPKPSAAWQKVIDLAKQGYVWEPGKPGIPSPRAKPFLTAEQMAQHTDRLTDYRNQNIGWDNELQRGAADAVYQGFLADRNFEQGASAATDAMIGRGLFQSSIRDGQLIDLDAHRVQIKDRLAAELDIRRKDVARRRNVLDDQWREFTKAENVMKVENAQAADAAMAPWKVAPTKGYLIKPAATGGTPVGKPLNLPVHTPPKNPAGGHLVPKTPPSQTNPRPPVHKVGAHAPLKPKTPPSGLKPSAKVPVKPRPVRPTTTGGTRPR